MSTSGVSLRHTLLISSNPQVADALRQITDRFQASLTRIDHVPPFVHQHMDLVFWHTIYPLDHAQYVHLRMFYTRVLAIYTRPPRGELLGPLRPFIPFMYFPFHPDDAVELILANLNRPSWP
jgi:hypothetical protein